MTARQDILKRFEAIKVWTRGDERAPNKPLLVLLGLSYLVQGRKRLVAFNDIEPDLRSLLTRYGPPRQTYHPNYPYWRLQNDRLWEVTGSDELGSYADPPTAALRKTEGGFPEEVFGLLSGDRKTVNSIVRKLLAAHFASSTHQDILQDLGLSETAMPRPSARSSKFRREVIQAYGHRCAICGYDVKIGQGIDLGLEAAHIKWHNAGGPCTVNNGLALCAIHHKAFDLGAIGLDNDLKIVISPQVYGSSGKVSLFTGLAGANIHMPNRLELLPTAAYLHWNQ